MGTRSTAQIQTLIAEPLLPILAPLGNEDVHLPPGSTSLTSHLPQPHSHQPPGKVYAPIYMFYEIV